MGISSIRKDFLFGVNHGAAVAQNDTKIEGL